jgi:hypothetical protein
MYYPSYSHGVYPYNISPYTAYPAPNGYGYYPVSNQVQYTPERKTLPPLKKRASLRKRS